MSRKSERIAELIRDSHGTELDPHYVGFFCCFNQQRYFEAHEVLEELWLPGRQGPNNCFYKGLIQLAGAFVHVQKGRKGPASALFRLAQANLGRYPAMHERLDLKRVQAVIQEWLKILDSRTLDKNAPLALPPPVLQLCAS